MGANSSRIWTWTSSARNCWISWARTGGGPHRSSSRPRPLRRRRRQSTRPDKRRAPSRPECSSPSSLHSVRGLARSELPLRQGSLNRPQHGGTSAWTTSRPSRTLTSKPRRSSRWVGTPFRRPSWQICRIWRGSPFQRRGALVRRAQVPRALTGGPPSPQLRALVRRALRHPGGPGHPGPGGAARGPALDDEQACRRGPHLRGPLGPTTGPRTRPGLGQQPHQGESGGAGKGYASQEPPGGWTPMGQVLF